jgi:hypothetical protein
MLFVGLTLVSVVNQSTRGCLFLPNRNLSSLKERCRVKRGFAGVLACLRACVTGVSCFPGSCHVRGERPGRSRTGRSPAAGAAPEASLR